jgi:hypothetical protein
LDTITIFDKCYGQQNNRIDDANPQRYLYICSKRDSTFYSSVEERMRSGRGWKELRFIFPDTAVLTNLPPVTWAKIVKGRSGTTGSEAGIEISIAKNVLCSGQEHVLFDSSKQGGFNDIDAVGLNRRKLSKPFRGRKIITIR